jgi:putative peptidoglycan lipid II flippase
VERFFSVLHKEWGGLHEAAFLLAGTAIMSQVLGLARDRLLAAHFGAGGQLDIYYAAFRIPDLLYATIASFVAVTVLIPFFLEHFERGKREAQRFMNSVFTVFFIAMVIASAVTCMLMPYLARLVVPGFDPVAADEFIMLSRILLLSPLLLGFSNLFGTIAQSLRRFFVFALGPVLYNIGILFGIVALMPKFGLQGVAYGVLIGAIFHVVIQLPVLLKESIVPRFSILVDWRAIREVVTLSIPRTIALTASNIAAIVLIGLASHIAEGSIAIFTLAMNLQSIPLSIVGMSYSVAAFPTLAKLWTKGDHEEFLGQIIAASRHIMFWSFPAIVLFIVLRAQIVRTILGSGSFDWTATRLTAAALALFALSIVAQNLVLLYTRAFYAAGRTKIPLVANVIGAVGSVAAAFVGLAIFRSSQTFQYFIETMLRVPDIAGTSVLMLPLGFSIGALLNIAILLIFAEKVFPATRGSGKRAFLHSFSSSVVMGFVAYVGLQIFDKVFDLDTFMGIFLQGLSAGLIAVIAWIFLLRLLENRELEEIRASLHQKFWKAKPIAAEVDGL